MSSILEKILDLKASYFGFRLLAIRRAKENL